MLRLPSDQTVRAVKLQSSESKRNKSTLNRIKSEIAQRKSSKFGWGRLRDPVTLMVYINYGQDKDAERQEENHKSPE